MEWKEAQETISEAVKNIISACDTAFAKADELNVAEFQRLKLRLEIMAQVQQELTRQQLKLAEMRFTDRKNVLVNYAKANELDLEAFFSQFV